MSLWGNYIPYLNNIIKKPQIDWGTSTNQIYAIYLPILDSGTYFDATNVEAALAELYVSLALTNTSYLKLDGSLTMAGDLKMGSQDILNANSITSTTGTFDVIYAKTSGQIDSLTTTTHVNQNSYIEDADIDTLTTTTHVNQNSYIENAQIDLLTTTTHINQNSYIEDADIDTLTTTTHINQNSYIEDADIDTLTTTTHVNQDSYIENAQIDLLTTTTHVTTYSYVTTGQISSLTSTSEIIGTSTVTTANLTTANIGTANISSLTTTSLTMDGDINLNGHDLTDSAGDLTINDTIIVTGDLTISQDLFVNGDEFIVNTQTIEVEDNIIVVNNGEVGPGITAGTAGMYIDRGSSTTAAIVYDESEDALEIGELGDLQPVATRLPSADMAAAGIAYWEAAETRLTTTDKLKIVSGQLQSTLASGTSPFSVSSTTIVTNLNVDQVDGVHITSATDTRLARYESTGTKLEDSAITETAGALGGITTLSMNNQLTNSLASGTAPFVITSTTKVNNFNVDQIDGVHIDSLTDTRLVRYESTGTKLENSAITETAGALGGITTLSMNDQLTNSLASGTAPFVITSTTKVNNLNVEQVDGVHITSATDTRLARYESTGTKLEDSAITETAGALGGITTLSMNNQLTNNLASGTAPFSITSTTKVNNLNVDQVDGVHITSATDTRLARYESTGTKLEDSAITETAGALGGITTLSMNNQLTNSLASGTAPFSITSTTKVNNLNVDYLDNLSSADFSPVAGSSSITTVGTIGTGSWHGTTIAADHGGTGVANGAASTITLGGKLATAGAYTTTFTVTGHTGITFPTSGTLVNSTVTTLSSLVSIGSITTGQWHGTTIAADHGGTGVANGAASTLTLGGKFVTAGAYTTTFTVTGHTGVTFPTTGTLATTAVTSLTSLVTIGNTLTLGGNAAANPTITFDADSHDGILTWDRTNALFSFDHSVLSAQFYGSLLNTGTLGLAACRTTSDSAYITIYGDNNATAANKGCIHFIGNSAGSAGHIRFYDYDGASDWDLTAQISAAGGGINIYDLNGTNYITISHNATDAVITTNTENINISKKIVMAAGQAISSTADDTLHLIGYSQLGFGGAGFAVWGQRGMDSTNYGIAQTSNTTYLKGTTINFYPSSTNVANFSSTGLNMVAGKHILLPTTSMVKINTDDLVLDCDGTNGYVKSAGVMYFQAGGGTSGYFTGTALTVSGSITCTNLVGGISLPLYGNVLLGDFVWDGSTTYLTRSLLTTTNHYTYIYVPFDDNKTAYAVAISAIITGTEPTGTYSVTATLQRAVGGAAWGNMASGAITDAWSQIGALGTYTDTLILTINEAAASNTLYRIKIDKDTTNTTGATAYDVRVYGVMLY